MSIDAGGNHLPDKVKKSVILVLCLVILCHTQCETPKVAEKYPPSAGYQGPHPISYEDGYRQGGADAKLMISARPRAAAGSLRGLQATAFVEGYRQGYRNYQQQGTVEAVPLDILIQGNQVTISRDNQTISTFTTEKKSVEKYQLVDQGTKIAVKSRSAGSPAVVELFDVSSGNRLEKIMSFAILYGEPAWARGMQD